MHITNREREILNKEVEDEGIQEKEKQKFLNKGEK